MSLAAVRLLGKRHAFYVLAAGLLIYILAAQITTLPLGQVVGWVAWLFLAWTTGVVDR